MSNSGPVITKLTKDHPEFRHLAFCRVCADWATNIVNHSDYQWSVAGFPVCRNERCADVAIKEVVGAWGFICDPSNPRGVSPT